MTATQVSQIGQRLLGIFLLVTGLSALAGTLAIFGFQFDAGASHLWVFIASALQGAVSVVAGALLARRPLESDAGLLTAASGPDAFVSAVQPALQVLGVYFVVVGLQSGGRLVLGLFWDGTPWQPVAAETGSGAIALAAGVGLIVCTSQVAKSLSRWRSTPSAMGQP